MFATEEPRRGDSAARRLATLAAGWGVPCDEAQSTALVAYADSLLRWSTRINLTAARSVEALVADHFPDAFALAQRLDQPVHLIDVGSGGGLPALPLALLRPSLSIVLAEPIAKKGAFLRAAIRELGLTGRVELAAARGEKLADSIRAGASRPFDVAISRATLPPDKWLALGHRLVRSGGRIFVLTTPRALPDEPRRQIYLDGKRVLIEVAVLDRST
jgi:16S rRNA (guanine527-N7)-methyltransferase